MRAYDRLRAWRGPPLALQILALLLGGLVVAQAVTLALTVVLPPAPPPQHDLREIAAALAGRAPAGRGLDRHAQDGPPDMAGPGWLVSQRSRDDLAALLGADPADVRLSFYTPLPFAGITGPPRPPALMERDPAAPAATLHPAALLLIAQAAGEGGPPPMPPSMPMPPGGGAPLPDRPFGTGLPGGPPPFGDGRAQIPSEPRLPPPPGGMRGDRGGMPSRGGIEGALPPVRPGSPLSIPPALLGGGMRPGPGGDAPLFPSTGAAGGAAALPPGARAGSGGIVLLPPAPEGGAVPPAGPFRGGIPGGNPSLQSGPRGFGRGPAMPGGDMLAVPGRPVRPADPEPRVTLPVPERAPLPPAGAAAAPALPPARAPAGAVPPAPPVVPAPRFSAPPAVAKPVPPVPAMAAEEAPARPRGLFGLAPAPYVEGDFLAALRRPDGGWIVVQPAAEGFPNAWQKRVLLWFGLAFALVAPLGWLFARRLSKPLDRFAEAAAALGRDPAAAIGLLDGPAEIGRAAFAFNLMQNRLRSFVDDRTAMVGAISHDLRTPLTRMRFRIEDVPDDVREGLLEEVAEMEAMIASVLAFVRDAATPNVRERLDLATLLADVVEDMAMIGGDVAVEAAVAAPVEVDVLGMRRVLANLIGNALKYGGRARIRLGLVGDEAVARVIDDGPGLPDDELEAVFQPFYRTAAARASDEQGFGLGLAVCRSIARAHGGDVRLARSAEGFAAEVRVPLAYAGTRAAA